MSWCNKSSGPSPVFFPWALVAIAWALGLDAGAAPYRLGPEPTKTATRVVTLAPSLTEVVLDLGLGERLVGVTRFDDAEEIAGLPRVGGFLDPSAETILGLRPDLLIVQPSPGNEGVVRRLATLGVPVLVVPLGTVEEIFVAIEAIATALDERPRGERLVKALRAGLEALQVPPSQARVPALIVYGWDPLVVAGPGSFADELLSLVGGVNVAAKARAKGAFPTLPAEVALSLGATRIFDATFHHGDRGRSLPGWEGPIDVLKDQSLARPGPRILDAAKELHSLLHPAQETP